MLINRNIGLNMPVKYSANKVQSSGFFEKLKLPNRNPYNKIGNRRIITKKNIHPFVLFLVLFILFRLLLLF